MTKRKRLFNRFVAFVLAFLILLPNVVFADTTEVTYLNEDSLEDIVYSDNLFYIGTSATNIDENSSSHYLLKIGRGGTAEDKATVTINMSDVTAKYGKDYKIKLYENAIFEPKADSTGNLALVEMMSDDYEEFEVGDAEELQKAIDDGVISGSALYEGAAMAMNDAIAANAEENGSDISEYNAVKDDLSATPIEEILADDDEDNSSDETAVEAYSEPSEETVDETVSDDGADTNSAGGTKLNTLVAARKAYTGMGSDRTAMTSSSDLLTQLYDLEKYQDVANIINESFVSATIDVTFDVGENVKYLEIIPIDNDESDGNRLFTVKLDVPSDGYTNSIYSSSNITIVDDEPEVLSKISFEVAQYTAEDNKVSVKIKREDGLNNISTVMLKSKSDTALSGRDFQPVNAEVVFPFGMSERTVEIAVDGSNLSETSDFFLYLEDYASAEAGDITETRVMVPPMEEEEEPKIGPSISPYSSDDEDAKLDAYGINDIVSANPRLYFEPLVLDNSKRTSTENSRGFDGRNSMYDDNTCWWMAVRSEGSWCNAYFRWVNDDDAIVDRYDINGVRVDNMGLILGKENGYLGYRKDRNNISAKNMGVGNWSWKTDSVYFDTDYSQECYVAVKYGALVSRVGLKNIVPIKRLFYVNLATEPLTFQDENGNQVADSEAAAAVFSDLKSAGNGVNFNDNQIQVVRTAGETITVTANTTKNGYKARLAKLEIVYPDGKAETVAEMPEGSTATSLSFTLDNKFISDHKDAVTFTSVKDAGKTGSFTIRPVFEKIPKTVTLVKNKNMRSTEVDVYNKAASFLINGKEYKIPSGKDELSISDFYVGDKINIVGKSSNSIYKPKAVGYYTWNKSKNTYNTYTEKGYESNSSVLLADDNNDAMKSLKLKLYPVFTDETATVRVRVKQSDIDSGCFDTTYGIFNTATLDVNDIQRDSIDYKEYIIAKNNVSVGESYTLMARASDGYALLWKSATDTAKQYTGETYYYTVESNYEDGNIIYLTATQNNVYAFDFNGTAKYLNYNMKTDMTSKVGFMPASGVVVSFSGTGATTDSDGAFETTPARYVNGAYVTYAVSSMGNTRYEEIKINKDGDTTENSTKEYNEVKVVNKLNDSGVWEQKTENTLTSGTVYSTTIGEIQLSSYNITDRCNVIDVSFERYNEVSKTYGKVYDGIDIDGGQYNFNATVTSGKSYTVSGIDSKTGKNTTSAKTENVTGVKFLIYDDSLKLKTTLDAKNEGENLWTVEDVIFTKGNEALYDKNDMIFVQLITDMDLGGNGSTMEYAPINTGTVFIKTNEYEADYEPQLFDLPLGSSYGSLPMLDKLAMGFNFPFVSVSLENNDDGTYTLQVGANVIQIVDKAKGTHYSKGVADNGEAYASMFTIKHPFQSFKDMASKEWSDTFTNAQDLFNGTTSRLGASAFTYNVTVGMYFTFGKLEVESTNGNKASSVVLLGGGGYIGASVGFSKAWYVLIGGIVPGYLGITASGNVTVKLGATRNESKVIYLNDMKDDSVELDDGLEFNTDLMAALSVAMYAGVGLCGTLGVRVGGEVDFVFVWYPMATKTWHLNNEPTDISSDKTGVSTTGTSTTFKLGGWIDVVMFTIPIMYSFDPINTGFAKQASDGKLVRRTSVTYDSTTTDGETTDFDIPNGWYYIKNAYYQQYLQIPEGTKEGEEVALTIGNKKTDALYNQKWFVYTDENGKTTITAYASESGNRQYVYSKNDSDTSIYKSKAVADSNVSELYDFMFKKVGDGIYISMPYNGYTKTTPTMLTVSSRGGSVVTKSTKYSDVSNNQRWLFELVTDTVAPGNYNIKNSKTNKVIQADTTDSNKRNITTAEYDSSATDKSQVWTVSYNKDGAGLIKSGYNGYYISLFSASLANNTKLITNKEAGTRWQDQFNFTADGFGHYKISSINSYDILITDATDSTKVVLNLRELVQRVNSKIEIHTKYDSSDTDNYGKQLWTFTSVSDTSVQAMSADVENKGETETNEMLLGNLNKANEADLTGYAVETEETESVTPEIVGGLSEPKLRERTSGDSVWVGEKTGNIEPYGGFSQTKESVLVDNSYERPDSQMMDMGNGKCILVFLDTDQSRGELERNALKYSIYDGNNWSEPITIQNDNTADFSPSIADADDSIAVAWTSSDPDTEKTGDATQYLTTTEIYTTLINKTTGEVGEITKLTNDTFYDSDPTILYDSTTGNMACYYLKSDVSASFTDSVSPVTNGCIVTYMLYDSEQGKWLFDYYYPGEGVSDENQKELIENWNGQRFLPSAIDDVEFVVNEDPIISDFTAISYNGLAVYAYTVDKDNDSSTDSDRDLFVQVMDMVNHVNYKPIRITDDDYSDALPQFVRSTGTEPTTRLYWFENGDSVESIDITDLVKEGINDDGTIKEDYVLAESSVQVKMCYENSDAKPAMSSYKVYNDKDDNTYIVWSDVDRSTGKQEIFATALIKSDKADSVNWADAYQLTHSGKYNDEPAFIVDNNGNLILVNDRYEMTINEGNAENPATISENQLVVTHFEPCGELYAQDILFDNLYPTSGTKDTISYIVKNKGLTAADGYTINVYESDGTNKKLIDTKQISDALIPGNSVGYTTDWTVPSNVDGVKIVIEVTENGMSNVCTTESDELKAAPYYSVKSFTTEQTNDGFVAYLRVTNVGNEPSKGNDALKIKYYREMASAEQLGITNTEFVSEPLNLAVGESADFGVTLNNISGDAFKAFGYVPVIAYAVDSDDEVASDNQTSRLVLTAPTDIKINGGVDSISLEQGNSVDLSVEFSPEDRFSNTQISYISDDISVATVVNGKLVPMGNGTTTVTAYIAPYNAYASVEVVVTGFAADVIEDETETTTIKTSHSSSGGGGGTRSAASKSTTETSTEETTDSTTDEETEETTEETTVVADNNTADAFTDISDHWGRDIINEVAGLNIVSGYEDNTFKPNNSITRAEFLTILYNSGLADTTSTSDDLDFADISGDEWYSDYVKWGVANNLIVGYEDNTFRGNNIISRQEMAVVVSKFVDLAGIDLEESEAIDFADGDIIAPWAKTYVDKISSYGIATGDDNNCYQPTKDLTRAETAVIINRLVK